MLGISPEKLLVLLAVGFVLLGPEKLPQMARDAARMLRTLRDLAQGARTQLTSELGPEFAEFDLASLNPRTAIRNALLFDQQEMDLEKQGRAGLGDRAGSGGQPRDSETTAPAPSPPGRQFGRIQATPFDADVT